MFEYLKSVRKAIRLIYVLIISLAFTEALKSLFIQNDIFKLPKSQDIILVLIFFSFITRFFMGAYRILSYDIEVEISRPKIIIDSIGFSFQALVFYVFSLIYHNFLFTQWLIIIICIVDLVWLALLAVIFKIKEDTYNQWQTHNIVISCFVLLNIFYFANLILLLIVSFLAFVIDFVYNREFYFSLKKSPGLRIFVAGPYGDNETEEVKEKNVEVAKQIGKELALKGHFPFIPHTMLHGWEMDKRFTIEIFKTIDLKWLEFCDALFFIAESSGSNEEKYQAVKKGLQIFTDLEKVPHV